MGSGKRWRKLTILAVSLAIAMPVANPANLQAQAPRPLGELVVPLPDLDGIVTDDAAAVALGKALFWDMQAGSDGNACASCHYHAGADNRTKNQLSPGLLRVIDPSREPDPDLTFGDTLAGNEGLTGSDAMAGANYDLVAGDFPFYRLLDMEDRHSEVIFDMNDAVSSQGTFAGQLVTPMPARINDRCRDFDPSVFGVAGVAVRKVAPRNTPTTINAVFNHRNFWDGRANNIFNGVDPFGSRNDQARVVVSDPAGRGAILERMALPNASLASQAVGPPLSTFEMICEGKNFADVGRRLLPFRPLVQQAVHAQDSVLAPYRNRSGKGLSRSYAQLVREAFAPKYWSTTGRYVLENSDPASSGEPFLRADGRGYNQMELNFSMFFGIAVMLYESTLVSDQTPFDLDALTPQQQRGLDVFLGKGQCSGCHAGSLFTGATVDQRQGELIERMAMASGVAVYDGGYYNIGVRPTFEDLGLGGTDPFGNPLSLSRQAVTGVLVDDLEITFQDETDTFPQVILHERVAVDGAFKVPTLRNVELTGPYMHTGGWSTLKQVVEFYDRGGDRRDVDCLSDGLLATGDTSGFGAADDLSQCSNLAPDMTELMLSDEEIDDLIAFMVALTDPRVKNESAPFDHPELLIFNGHAGDQYTVEGTRWGQAVDEFLVIPAVGRYGRSAEGLPPIGTFLDLSPFDP